MAPKEKAEELFNKMFNVDDPMGSYPMCYETAKQCALIAVDEILNNPYNFQRGLSEDRHDEFWQEVKYEIEKL